MNRQHDSYENNENIHQKSALQDRFIQAHSVLYDAEHSLRLSGSSFCVRIGYGVLSPATHFLMDFLPGTHPNFLQSSV